MPKKISVNFGTMVDLKAELFRKQEQAQRQKQEKKNDAASTSSYVKGGKPILYEARKAAVAQEKLQRKGPQSIEKRRQLEERESALREEERQLSRSKQSLEAKAALYEKLQNGRSKDKAESEDAGLYLVNFERKAFDKRESDTESDRDTSDDESASTSRNRNRIDDDKDWVEYTDVLGRTRKCLRRDLHDFIAADEKLKERRRPDTDTQPTALDSVNQESELLSADMRSELKRRAWEREEEEKAAIPVGPIHYQHVAQGESRELGVGYFPFAPDEQTRREQLRLLDDLRQQTVSQRVRSQNLKEKRQAALKARLDKVKERKKLKLEDDDEVDDEDDEDEVLVAHLDDIPLPPSTSFQKSATASLPAAPSKKEVRPWDVGKPKIPQQDWTEKRRQEREKDFAPPSYY